MIKVRGREGIQLIIREKNATHFKRIRQLSCKLHELDSDPLNIQCIL